MNTSNNKQQIAIVGAGFTGSSLAYQILSNEDLRRKYDVTLIESTKEYLFRGRAYVDNERNDLLNVRAKLMGITPKLENEFFEWLSIKFPEKYNPDDFVPRKIFGSYVEFKLLKFKSAGLTVVQDEVLNIDSFRNLHFKSGEVKAFDKIFLATGIQPVELSKVDCFDQVERVFIKGCGLSAIDQVLELKRVKFKGSIILYSRRGLLPLVHDPVNVHEVTKKEIKLENVRLIDLFKSIRYEVKLNPHNQYLVHQLRPLLKNIWSSFTPKEKRQFAKYVKPYWEVFRHRMCLQQKVELEELLVNGQLKILKVKNLPNITMNDLVIDCSGFRGIAENVLIKNLFKNKMIQFDELNWGLHTDGSILIKDWLYCVGPMRRFELFETTAVKEIREQIEMLIFSL